MASDVDVLVAVASGDRVGAFVEEGLSGCGEGNAAAVVATGIVATAGIAVGVVDGPVFTIVGVGTGAAVAVAGTGDACSVVAQEAAITARTRIAKVPAVERALMLIAKYRISDHWS